MLLIGLKANVASSGLKKSTGRRRAAAAYRGETSTRKRTRRRRLPRLGTSLLIGYNLLSGLTLAGLGVIALQFSLVGGLVLTLPGLALLANAVLLFTPWLWPRYFSIAVNALGTLLMAWLLYGSMQLATGFDGVLVFEFAVLVFYALFIHQSWVMVKDKRAELRERRAQEADLAEEILVKPGWDEGSQQ